METTVGELDIYRKSAKESLEMAEKTDNEEFKAFCIRMAKHWTRLGEAMDKVRAEEEEDLPISN
jgi:hypothetical protein